MNGIFTYIVLMLMVDVDTYTIDGPFRKWYVLYIYIYIYIYWLAVPV